MPTITKEKAFCYLTVSCESTLYILFLFLRLAHKNNSHIVIQSYDSTEIACSQVAFAPELSNDQVDLGMSKFPLKVLLFLFIGNATTHARSLLCEFGMGNLTEDWGFTHYRLSTSKIA